MLIQFFDWYCGKDCQHWVHFKNEIPRLLELGITAVWLPPAYKGSRGADSEGYDVYDIYDLGEFNQKGSVNTKYGSKQDYVDAVNAAREAGLQVYVDIVLNHMGGAENTEKVTVRKVDPEDRTKFISEPFEIEAYTRFTFNGRAGKYSQFMWDKNCFTGIDHAKDMEDEGSIYSILNEYGDGWEPMVDTEKGNFDYLMMNDIETRNPAVREELKRWIKWYYETVPFDGVRLDAVKHINPDFFIEWLDYVRAEVKPDMFALGEFWLSDNLGVLLKYIEVTEGRMSLFDAPFHLNMSTASKIGKEYDMRGILHDSLVSHRPELAVTFVDNHDTQPLQSLEQYTEQWFKPHAYALILLRQEGYPCIFYPDLYGTKYEGYNKEGEHCQIEIPPLWELPMLMSLRRDKAHGEQEDYFDDPNCVGWVRRGVDDNPDSGLAVLLNNGEERMTKLMKMGEKFADSVLYNVFDPEGETVHLNGEGEGEFSVDAGKTSVWVLDNRQ